MFDITMNDVNSNPIDLYDGNVVRLMVGQNGAQLDLRSDRKTPQRSFMTLANPTRVVIEKDDLCFYPGMYDVELLLMSDAQGSRKTTIATGSFNLRPSDDV